MEGSLWLGFQEAIKLAWDIAGGSPFLAGGGDGGLGRVAAYTPTPCLARARSKDRQCMDELLAGFQGKPKGCPPFFCLGLL